MRGTDFKREFVPQPTDFLCFAKESQQRKATPGRTPVRRLRRRWSLALLESQGRHGMARRLRRRLAVTDSPLTFCDAQRALRGEKRRCATVCARHTAWSYGSPRPTAQTVRQLHPGYRNAPHFLQCNIGISPCQKNALPRPPCPLTVATNRHAPRCPPPGGQGAQT